MSSRVEHGHQAAGIPFEFTGAPEWVVEAAKRNASKDPEAFEAAKQRLQERHGVPFSWDPETKLFERLPAGVVHVPERREPVASPAARPRERRVRRSRGSTSRGDPSEPPPARPPLTAAERAYLRARIDARRREVVRATEKVERSLERHWKEDAA
jgi:hypothetical protein